MKTVRRYRGTILCLGAIVLVAAGGLGAGVARADVQACDHVPPRSDNGRFVDGHHVIYGEGEINGTPGADFIVGSDHPDTIRGGAGQDIVCAGGGDDVIYGGGLGDDLHGQAGDDKIFGGLLDDHLYGEAGDDLLVGGHGVDEMFGGDGSDWLRGGTNTDLFYGDDPRDPGRDPGVDVASFADVTPSAKHAGGVHGVVVNLTGKAQDGAQPGTAVGDGTDELHGIESVIGSPFDDVLLADPSVKHPKLFGGMGDDRCTPGPCIEPSQELRAPFAYLDTDTPLPGPSPDPMLIAVGGAAGETFTLDGGTVTASAGGTAESLATLAPCTASPGGVGVSCPLAGSHEGGGVAWFGDGGDDTITVTSAFPAAQTVDLDGGDGSDAIHGGNGGETLYSGDSGDDVLDGGGGEDALIAEGTGGDRLDGGAGNDQLVTTNPCEGHTYRGGPGIDIAGFARTPMPVHAQLGNPKADPGNLGGAFYGAAYVIGAKNCARTLVGGDLEILEGTQHADVLIGNNRANTIWGRKGNDRIYGRGGNDRLDGMQGKDKLFGGAGHDVLRGGVDEDKRHPGGGKRSAGRKPSPKPEAPSRGRVPLEGTAPGGGGRLPAPSPSPGLTATQAFVTVDQALNGQPGWVTVHGHVLGGAAPLDGVFVNVNFEKQQPDGSWATMSSAHPVLANGAYEVDDWRVGDGQWRVRTVFPQQGTLAESVSDYRSFGIGAGYRLVNRHSGLCLTISQNSPANGTPIIQWPCSPAPSPGDGQVLTRVPMGGGFSELAFNSTGKCLDVPGASLADGAFLQEWDCLGAGQANQLWQAIPIAGQDGWFAFAAKHSGKCADALGMSVNAGSRIGQWTCTWAGNQQWSIQAIG